jgi:polyamine oxidase
MGVWQNINAPGYFPQNTSANILMVTAVDILAREYENLSDEDIQAQAMVVLREMYGNDIPDANDILVPRWAADPLYRGSYSNWPLGVLDEHHWNLRQPVGGDRVWFTGEAMSPEAFGYVQGAWDEGQATAKTVGSCLTGGECQGAEIYPALTTCAQTSAVEALQKRSGARMAKRHGTPGGAARRRR